MKMLKFIGLVVGFHAFEGVASTPMVIWLKTSEESKSPYRHIPKKSGLVKRLLLERTGSGTKDLPIEIDFSKEELRKIEEYFVESIDDESIIEGLLENPDVTEEKLVNLIKASHSLEIGGLLEFAIKEFLKRAKENLPMFTDANFPGRLGFSPGVERSIIRLVHTKDELGMLKSLLYRELSCVVKPSIIQSSPSRNFLAVFSADSPICEIWDTRAEKRNSFLLSKPVVNGFFDQQGLVFIGYTDDAVFLFEGVSGKKEVIEMGRYFGTNSLRKISCIGVSNDCRYCAVGYDDQVALIRIADKNVQVLKASKSLEGRAESLTFSRDGTRVLELRSLGTTRLWDLEAGECTVLLENDARGEAIKCIADGYQRFFAIDSDGVASSWVYNQTSKDLDKTLLTPVGGRALGFDSNVKKLFMATGESGARVLNMTLKSHEEIPSSDFFKQGLFHPHNNKTLIALTQNGNTGKHSISIWEDAGVQELIARIPLDIQIPRHIGITGDGNNIFIAGDIPEIRLLSYFDENLHRYLTDGVNLEQSLGLWVMRKSLQAQGVSEPIASVNNNNNAAKLLYNDPSKAACLQRIYETLDHTIIGKGLSTFDEAGVLGFSNKTNAFEYFSALAKTAGSVEVRAAALLIIGNLYFEGLGVKKDYRLAEEKYEAADILGCDWVSAVTHLKRGDIALTKGEFSSAENFYTRAATQRNYLRIAAMAQCKIGKMCYNGLADQEKNCPKCKEPNLRPQVGELGRVVVACNTYGCTFSVQPQPHYEEAWEWYRKALDQDFCPASRATARRWLGESYLWNLPSFSRDLKKARDFFEAAARQDDSLAARAEAELRLALMCFYGYGEKSDFGKTLAMFEQLANQTDSKEAQAAAWRWIGQIYYRGLGVQPDFDKAAECFGKAVSQNYCVRSRAEAEVWLGEMYCLGKGLAFNLFEARRSFERAYKQSYSLWAKTVAAYWLGKLAADNYTISKKDSEGGKSKNTLDITLSYYEEAISSELVCPFSCAKACFELGVMHAVGFGVEADHDKSTTYFLKAKNFFKNPTRVDLCSREEAVDYLRRIKEIEEDNRKELPSMYKLELKGIVGKVPMPLLNVLRYVQNPQAVAEFGLSIPKGILMYGPPGTGKTAIARALADALGGGFIAKSGTEFVTKFQGSGSESVNDLFKEARELAVKTGRLVVIFIDEIDLIAPDRSSFAFSGGGYQETVNALLTNMDGFKRESNIIVLASTNKIDLLDPAILRPGRFDYKVEISYPDEGDRVKILMLYLGPSERKLEKPVEEIAVLLAEQTENWSPAELKDIIEKAKNDAFSKGLTTISQECIMASYEAIKAIKSKK